MLEEPPSVEPLTPLDCPGVELFCPESNSGLDAKFMPWVTVNVVSLDQATPKATL